MDHLPTNAKSEYAVIHNMSGCTPLALSEGPTYNFSVLVQEQYQRLQAFYTANDISNLQDEYNHFHDRYNDGDGKFKTFVKCISEEKTFDKIWNQLSGSYHMLIQFAGGLHSIFPGTPTVEGDFRNITIEKNENRQRLSTFTLEGIHHANQRNYLENIEVLLKK